MMASDARLPSLQPAVIPFGSGSRRLSLPAGESLPGGEGSGRRGRAWALDQHAQEDRMRLVAALLVLATLLVWILFLQG